MVLSTLEGIWLSTDVEFTIFKVSGIQRILDKVDAGKVMTLIIKGMFNFF
ncbi:Uncharacterised protein [Klebsiella pneumoniae]|nr:Uncharacterised protein [Klebsiella pneumoniae]